MITIHQVKEVLGEEVVDDLCEHFAGQQIYIPKKKTSQIFRNEEEKNEYIFNMCTRSGKTYEEVAALTDLTKDRVSKIVAEMIKNGLNKL